MNNRIKPDWEAIEEDYRAGVLSIRMIATRHNTKESSVRSRARRNDWQRDLTSKVKQATSNKLLNADARTTGTHSEERETDREIIERASDEATQLVMSHRANVAEYRELSTRISGYLMKVTLTDENHVAFTRSLNAGIDALAKAIKLERQAFGLDDQQSGTYEDGLEALLNGLEDDSDSLAVQ